MALLDVSKVTETLIELLERRIPTLPEWPSGVTLDVSPDPPDLLSGQNVLGIYLYHLTEDPGTKNLVPPGGNSPPVAYAPMGLSLHYQLSAHTEGNGASTLSEQRMMGMAAKTLHDFPVIDDDTRVGTTQILNQTLRDAGNRLRIALQPVPFGEAVSYWTAGPRPLRLAAYYEVSVIMLEPESATRRPGRVLERAVETFVGGRPRLEGSRSVLTFTPPGQTQPSELEVQPAQASYGGTIELTGTGLAGASTHLALRASRWPEPIVVDDVSWGVVATAERVRAVVRQTTGPGGNLVLPGVYGASVRVSRRFGSPPAQREVEQGSNHTPIVVMPRVDPIPAPVPPAPANLFTVTGGVFSDPALEPESVEAYFGEARLGRVNATPGPGQFRVVSPTTLEARLPAGLVSGQSVGFRLIVEGAESEPRWVTVP
jgi:Pvc16 N-terminal domain